MTKKRRVFFETQEVIRKTKRGYVDLEMDYFQFYNAAFSYIASLSSNCSKDFILWIMGRVDEENKFQYSKELLVAFNDALAKIPKPKNYAEITVNKSLKELVDHSIILRTGRGDYTVNPKLFWSEEVSQRIKTVQNMEEEVRRLPEHDSIMYPVFKDEELYEEKSNGNEEDIEAVQVETDPKSEGLWD